MSRDVLEGLAEYGVVPVIAIEKVEWALPLADALIAGGLPLAEITFRTPAASAVLELLATERPDLLLGAGTVLTPEHAQRAKECGAAFAVAPGLNPAVVERAGEIGLPFMPGIQNPTDIETALSLGCRRLKYFPAEASGGIRYLKAIAAPYIHTGVQFMPTGGVDAANLDGYLALPAVLACGGTWLAGPADLAAGNWEAITARCREAASIVARDRVLK